MLMNKNDNSRLNLIYDSDWIRNPRLIKKNLFILGLAWVFLFTAFQSMANLQSSLNSENGLGTKSLSIIYITLVTSCFFVPPFMIKKLGLKTSILASQLAYLLYISANVYPTWYFLFPTAALVGIFAGPLWTAKCTYLTEIAGYYSSLTGESNEAVVNRFFGIFFTMFQMSQIIGNLISSAILKPEQVNRTVVQLEEHKCGVGQCSAQEKGGEVIKRPQLVTVYLLCFVYVMLGLVSMFLIRTFLNDIKREAIKSDVVKKSTAKLELFVSTITQMKHGYQLLIIPLTLWLGFSLAFIGADYTRSFVACSKGVNIVGYTMIWFGVTNAGGSYLFGIAAKHVGRVTCFLTAAFINYAVIAYMWTWDVSAQDGLVFYMIPAFWGVADAAWQTQVNSLYGVLFRSNQEAAFSNFRLWESVGFAVSYGYSTSICTSTKLMLLVVYLTVGLLCYLAIELNESFIAHGGKQSAFASLSRKLNPKVLLCFIFIVCILFYLLF